MIECRRILFRFVPTVLRQCSVNDEAINVSLFASVGYILKVLSCLVSPILGNRSISGIQESVALRCNQIAWIVCGKYENEGNQ